MERTLRVLVVDDSAYVRKVVKQMLARSPFIEVVGTARDGVEALEAVQELEPDVVTLDLMMPELDGVGFLREQMARRPLPVVVVSIAGNGSELALRALDAGAVDLVQKPTALATERVVEMADELIAKIRAAGDVPLARLAPVMPSAGPEPRPVMPPTGRFDVVVIGVSTGGPRALKTLVPQLPRDFPVPLAIVLHMPLGYTEMYAHSLDALSSLEVREAAEGDALAPGRVLLAPAGRHMTFKTRADGTTVAHLDAQPFDTPHRPSVDVLFRSAAATFGSHVLGVVMTGMGADGQQGAAWIKAQGGMIFTEAEQSCVVYGMARSVVEAGLSDRSVALPSLARAIVEAV